MMLQANRAKWIWYPGDFEIWLHGQVSLRRDERRSMIPPFWRLDTHYTSVKFSRAVELERPEEVLIEAEGRYNITLDGEYIYGNPERITIPAGKHRISINVVSSDIVPAVRVLGETLVSDSNWTATIKDHRSYPAGSWKFDTSEDRPSEFRLRTEAWQPVHKDSLCLTDSELAAGSVETLFDFGKETFGYVRLSGVAGSGQVSLYYGESREEALSRSYCETYDEFQIDSSLTGDVFIVPNSRAFRYVQVVCGEGIAAADVDMLYEYLPVEKRGRFRSSDERLNEIWDVSEYTLHLTTREFFLDGIKRDRWVWSGDAYQSFLMNYYTFFECDVTRRTFIALRGKDPFDNHINHILDYSFYWVIALHDYYQYTGDLSFVRDLFPKMCSLMQFCEGRVNEHGFMEGYREDWVFIDWADMDNKGEVAFEQILFCRSLEIAALFADMFGEERQAALWMERAQRLRKAVVDVFWDEEQGGLVHSRRNGELNRHMTKYANLFALMFNFMDEAKAESIRERVLKNDKVQPIVTPYMRFYELATMCEMGEHDQVREEINRYWGGMLDLGATSFWEKYDPAESGDAHYAMYDRPFAKSLCHSWGASPLYLIGKYFLGVRPLTPGYETYSIEPHLGGLEWMEGAVPLPDGQVELEVTKRSIKVTATAGTGKLRFNSVTEPMLANEAEHDALIELVGSNLYEITILPGKEYEINYQT